MIETNRLILRKLNEGDKEAFFLVIGDDDVTRYMSNNTYKDMKQIDRLFSYWLPLYDSPLTERYAIILKETNFLIGYIDIVAFIDNVPEIGYALNKSYWNKGYMSEALEAFSNYLFNDIGYQELIIGVIEENIGSNKVAIKNGFILDKKEERLLSESKPYKVHINWYKKQNPNYQKLIKMVRIVASNLVLAHEIERTIFPEYDAYNNYLDSQKINSLNEYWLLKVDDKFVGISGIYSYKDYPEDAWLGWFGLLEEYRHLHLGSQALALFEIEARRRGHIYARLFTDRNDNDVAKRFYKARGYKEEYYENDLDPASKLYPLSIYSKALSDKELIPWNNRDIHFTKQVEKQQ